MTDFKWETCCKCKTRFAMSQDIYHIATERRDGFAFYCPNGHPQYYATGQTEEEKLRRERDRLKQEQARLYDRIREEQLQAETARNSARAYKGAATRMKNRAKAGVCPCCNRHFTDLERHMQTKHSDADLNNVIEIGRSA